MLPPRSSTGPIFASDANGLPYMGMLNPDWTTLNPAREAYLLSFITRTKL